MSEPTNAVPAYPPAVTSALAHLRARTVRTIYAATMLRTAYAGGAMPSEVKAVYDACVRGKGVAEALRGLS